MSSRLAGKVAIVTGASSGIGEAVAKMLAREGMKVAMLARRVERLQATAKEMSDALAIGCDVRDEAQILAAFAEVRARWGGVDLLVNNAGLGRVAPLSSGSTEAFREMLEVNVLALAICTREAVTDMKRRDVAGHIVHVSSMAAHRVPAESGMYAARKFAVRGLLEALRKELRAEDSPIRVSAVSPGYVRTEFAQVYSGDPDAAAHTYGRFTVLEPDDVAELVRTIVTAPPHVQVHDVLVRSTDQPD
ncbi:MAG TPA: SDR family NAD(P)-dependent oxidoreductase [Nannocystaceae bacterium]|nr:SDR family NAD(P)-dependent oxidoreductase [Nannocystaceae bacterium]